MDLKAQLMIDANFAKKLKHFATIKDKLEQRMNQWLDSCYAWIVIKNGETDKLYQFWKHDKFI